MTPILHAMLPIPCIPRLQHLWFNDNSDSGEASDKHQWGWKALWDSLPPRANHANSPTQEPCSQASSPGVSTKGKEKERNLKELDKIITLVGKASERKIDSQVVVLDGGMQPMLEKAKRRDEKKVYQLSMLSLARFS